MHWFWRAAIAVGAASVTTALLGLVCDSLVPVLLRSSLSVAARAAIGIGWANIGLPFTTVWAYRELTRRYGPSNTYAEAHCCKSGYVLWGISIGFVLGTAEATLAAWGTSPPDFLNRALFYYSQFGFAGPYLGGVIGYVVFKRRELRILKWLAAGRCCGCGYNLTGNVSGICPECGTPVPKRTADAAGVQPTEQNEQA